MVEKKISLALVIHNHQPVGNTDSIIEQIYLASYLPFLKKLSEYPQIKVNLHYTGFLLEWFENHHPDFIALLKTMIDRGQIELLGGAYYEPVLPVIPDEDASGQTAMLSQKIRSLFDVEAHGFWTAERGWEPGLPEILALTSAGHTYVDDVSFESSGLSESGCFEPYLVESRGSFVTVFPILKKLRYYIPFKPVTSTVRYLRTAAEEERQIAVYADDGEKFGAWPTTFERVYEQGWLESFFNVLVKEDWIETIKISEFLESHPASKRIYLPASTYSEMMEWSIPLYQTSRRKTKGEKVPLRGFWRLFLAKYPESANLYSTMLRLSKDVHSLDSSENAQALVHLWRGQCNDAYWHGVFGGLYAPILRRITYTNLIKGRVEYEKIRFKSQTGWSYVNESGSGVERKICLDNEYVGLTIFPASGGTISELDFKPKSLNLFDTLARRPERYHQQIKRSINRSIVPNEKKSSSIHDRPKSTEKDLAKLLIYDRYPKYSFIDHLLNNDTTITSFEKQNYREKTELANCSYGTQIQNSDTEAVISMRGTFRTNDNGIELNKTIHIPADSATIKVDYQIKQTGAKEKLSGLFVPELNLGALSDEGFGRRYSKSTASKSPLIDVSYAGLGVQINFEFQMAESCWIVPVKTVSLSEKGFESNLQGISILPNYRLDLAGSNEQFKTSIEMRAT